MKLSFTCIGHNEKQHLSELIPQLRQWGDEVIYVDCESADRSYEEAEKLGARVFRQPNNMNLNVNKSFAMAQATGDWIFYVDPDERLPAELMTEVRSLLVQTRYAAFKVSRKNYFFGQWLRHGGQFPDTQLRMFRAGTASFPRQHVHEVLQVNGEVGRLAVAMEHYPYLTISQFLKKFDFYSSFEAQHMYDQGIRPSLANHFKYLWWKPQVRFFRRYVLKAGFKDGIPGLFAAFFDAVGWMTRYFKLWEIHKNQRNNS